MKKENITKLKPYLKEIEKFVDNKYYNDLNDYKVKLFKEIYYDETKSNEYNNKLTCNRCRLNLVTDIWNLYVKHLNKNK